MKVLIIDDHAVVREGVASVVTLLGADTIILQARDCASGLEIADQHADLDLVLLDLVLPDVTGMGALEQFGRRHSALPLVVLSASEDPNDVRRALALGALGYLPKSASSSTVLAALRLVLSGEIYVPLLMGRPAQENLALGAGLTDRQQEVLRLIAEDVSNKEIAYRLKVSEKTVKAHVTAILRALKVTNRLQAARAARTYSGG